MPTWLHLDQVHHLMMQLALPYPEKMTISPVSTHLSSSSMRTRCCQNFPFTSRSFGPRGSIAPLAATEAPRLLVEGSRESESVAELLAEEALRENKRQAYVEQLFASRPDDNVAPRQAAVNVIHKLRGSPVLSGHCGGSDRWPRRFVKKDKT